MSSWKQHFRRLNEEYETAQKKRQALDNLLDSGKISQSTHAVFNAEIDETIRETEKQQKALLEKMNSKMAELIEQLNTLEVLLANYEIQHVTGEIDDHLYESETNVLSTGLETTKQELASVKEAISQLSSDNFTEKHDTEPRDEPIVEFLKTEENTQEQLQKQEEQKT